MLELPHPQLEKCFSKKKTTLTAPTAKCTLKVVTEQSVDEFEVSICYYTVQLKCSFNSTPEKSFCAYNNKVNGTK